MVSDSEHHFEPSSPSCPRSHTRSKIMLWLELHISLREKAPSKNDKNSSGKSNKQQRVWGQEWGRIETEA